MGKRPNSSVTGERVPATADVGHTHRLIQHAGLDLAGQRATKELQYRELPEILHTYPGPIIFKARLLRSEHKDGAENYGFRTVATGELCGQKSFHFSIRFIVRQ